MADVFISYSRKDKAFVQQLDEALKRRDREAWVDWEGIRPTEEFMQAIYGAIEGADTFIFILSPDSVSSVVCGKEIAHAVAQNKRMVPLVARDVNAAEVPEALAKLNWIFCRQSDDFEQGAATLISALDTDLDWVRAHTRLITRAIEWEAKGRNNSFVLRGDDLRSAEQWLTEAGADKERQPTPLQTEYIIASRKAAARRQRILLGASTFAMIVTIVLAVLAYLNAEKTKETLANADFLRAAELIDQNRVDEALPYLARSLRTRPSHDAAADRIFSLLTERSWMLPASEVTTLPGRITAIRFTDNGGCLAASIAGDAAQVFDLRTGKPVTAPLHHDGRTVQMARLNGDGTRLATACGGGDFSSQSEVWPPVRKTSGTEVQGTPGHGRVWNVATGEPLTPPLDHPEAVLDICFDTTGDRVATAGADKTVRVWDSKNGTAITSRLQHDNDVHSVRFSPDGLRLLTASNPMCIWEIASGQRLPIPKLEGVIAAEYSPDGLQIAAVVGGTDDDGHQLQHLQLASADGGQPAPEKSERFPVITSFTFDAPRKRVLISYAGEYRNKDDTAGVDEIETETGKLRLTHPMHGTSIFSTLTLPEGDVLTAGGDRAVRLRRWSYSEEEIHLSNPLKFPATPLHLESSLSGKQFAVVFGNDGRSAQLWNAPKSIQESEIIKPDKVRYEASLKDFEQTGMVADTSRDGKRVLRFDSEKSLSVYDAKTGARISGPFQAEGGYEGGGIGAAKFNPTGDMIALGEGGDFRLQKGYARVWNANTSRPVTGPLLHTLAVTQVSFSEDNKRLLTVQCKLGSSLFTARVWDLTTGIALTDRMPTDYTGADHVRKLPQEGEFAILDRSRGQLTNFSPTGIAEIQDIAFPAGSKAPDWFPLLIDLTSGSQLNLETGVLEAVPEHFSKLEALRSRLGASKDSDPFTTLGRWFLGDPKNRTLSPYSKVTTRDYIERCIATGGEDFLKEAERLARGDPELLAKIKAGQQPP